MSREPEARKAERETMGREVSAVMSGESAALGQGTANPKAMNRDSMNVMLLPFRKRARPPGRAGAGA